MKKLLMLASAGALSWCWAATEVNWTGGGADTLMTTPENWASAVDLTDGSVKAAFATGGTKATAVGSVYMSGIGLNTASAFTVDAADGASLGLGADGITTAGTGSYTISAPIEVKADQTWTIGKEMELKGALNSDASRTITKTGSGALVVSGGGDFAGNVDVSGTGVRFAGENALGSGKGTITAHEATLTFAGGTVCKDIYYDCGDGWNDKSRLSLWAGISVARGSVSFSNRNFNIYPYSGSVLTFENGFSGTGYPYFREGAGGRLVFTKVPVSLSQSVIFMYSSASDSAGFSYYLDFAVAGNSLAGLGTTAYPMAKTKVTTTVDWAFDNANQSMVFKDDSVFDLCGTSQRVGQLDATATEGHRSVITGSAAAPSKLYLNWKKASTPAIDFTGNLSVDFSGAYVTTIDHAMTSTGEISVQAGTLAFTADGSWATASKLTVADGAAVTIAAAGTLGANAEVVLDGTGSLSIPSGVTESVGFLTIGGERQKRGSYQMGDGTLEVRYSGHKEIVDGALVLAEGEKLTLDADTLCDSFDTVVLGDGAELDIQDPVFIDNAGTYQLAVGADATLTLAEGIVLYAPGATVDGAAVAPGRHTSETWLKGDGAVYVPYGPITGTDVSWTGGAEEDTRMTTAANWSAPVDLANGTSRAVFATGGQEASVVGSTFLNGLDFTSAGAFAVKGADETSKLRLASGGVTVTGSKSYEIDVPVCIEGDQTWAINGTELSLRAPLDSDPMARYVLHKTGARNLNVMNGGTFAGTLSIEQGGVVVYGADALDSTNGSIVINKSCGMSLAGATINKPITIDPDGTWGASTALSVWGDYPASTVKGKLTYRSGNIYIYIYSNDDYHGKLVLEGGVDISAGYGYFSLSGGGAGKTGYSTLVVTNSPIVSVSDFYPVPGSPNKDGIAFKLYLAAAGNSFPEFGHPSYHLKSCELYTTIDGAFDKSDMRVYADYDFTWDLCGTTQTVGFLDTYSADGHRPPTFTGSAEKESTLSFTQTADSTFKGLFSGKLGVVMNGSRKLTVNTAQTAAGGITVNGGTLEFTGNGSWRKSTALTVTGSGRVTVAASRTLGKKSVVTLASADSLYLAPGVEQWVSRLTIGGVEITAGEYRCGDGVLKIGTSGFSVIVR